MQILRCHIAFDYGFFLILIFYFGIIFLLFTLGHVNLTIFMEKLQRWMYYKLTGVF